MKIFLYVISSIYLSTFSSNLFAERSIDYYVNIGGIQIADVNFIIKSKEEVWLLKSKVEAAGVVDVFIKFTSLSTSSGKIIGNSLIPDNYNFSYETSRGGFRKGEINYINRIPIELKADPDYEENEKPSKKFMRTYGENSNDPYSALIIHGSYNDPCKYTSHGFDGIRAFKTRFVKPGKAVNIKIGNEKYNSIKCIGYFDPIVGYKESDFLDQVSKPGSVKYWYKFLEKENLWLPVKVIIETPLGGFVMKAKSL